MSNIQTITQKISELVERSKQLYKLGYDLQTDQSVRQRLAIDYQQWYREAYSILEEK